MAECKHEWQGNAEGVVCIKCGKKLTHEQYVDLTTPKEPKKTTKKKKD